MRRTALAAIALGLAGSDAGAQESRFRPLPGQEKAARPAPSASAGTAIANLPYARGRSFRSLDAYLAFRREQGAIDLPWYKEIAPDLFELQTTIRPAPPRRRFTRQELAKRFGFAR
jgi:hypothetical protein